MTETTITTRHPFISLAKLMDKFNQKKFITTARRIFNILAALFSVVLAVQYYETKGAVNLEIVSTMAVLGTMYALANKCQTHLLKMRIEAMLSDVSVFDSAESKGDN